jgi:hypothetical protein
MKDTMKVKPDLKMNSASSNANSDILKKILEEEEAKSKVEDVLRKEKAKKREELRKIKDEKEKE